MTLADALNPDFETPEPSLGNPDLTTLRVALYDTIADLPAPVRNHLPKDAQQVFMSVVNQYLKKGKPDSTAFPIAWGVIKKHWHKDGDGRWVRNAGVTPDAISESVSSVTADHDTILLARLTIS